MIIKKTYFVYMHILVYGSNGWIGSQFINILKKYNISYSCGKSRVDNDKHYCLKLKK